MPGTCPPTVYWPPAVTSSSSAGKRVITSQPSDVTTSCSSIRAADQPSAEGQNVSSANTIPPSIGGIVERDEPREDRLLPDREPDAVPVLEREGGLLVREAELLGLREALADDLRRRHARLDHRDRAVEDVAAALVRVDERARRGADGERPVVAGAIAVVRVEDVEVRGVAGPQHPVGEDVRM